MKILMVHPHDLYSKLEPWTVRIKYIAQEFVKFGHQVRLVYFPLFGRLQNKNEPLTNECYEEIPFPRKKKCIFHNILRMQRLAKWADIIHFQKCFSHASLPALFASYFCNKPIHYDWDDWELQIFNYNPPSKVVGYFLNLLEKSIPRLVDTVSVSSDRLRFLCMELGVNEDRIFKAHVGADLERFNPNISGERVKKRYRLTKPTVLYLGQLHGAQYAELFIKAVEILTEKEIEADYMIVGGGARCSELRDVVDNLGLNRDIVFTGAVKHEEVPEYIAASDIAVACFEDNDITRCKSPLKIAEYLASGKPIVASKVGEVTDMVDGCGILTEPGDPISLAEGIFLLLKDKELRVQMGHRARKRAEEKYNWTVTAKNLLKAYELAMEIH